MSQAIADRTGVFLVGAGPGAADLLTLRAARVLAAADIVLHDALIEPEVLALAAQARLLNVGKRAGRASTDQAFINRLLVRCARHYRTVVRLKGGDPLLFGRAQEEIDACARAGIGVEVIPGVSAGFAAAARLGVSLTQRAVARSVTFLSPAVATGVAGPDWAAAAGADTLVIYMAKANAAAVRDALLAQGLAPETPAAVYENIEKPGEVNAAGQLWQLPALAERLGDGPALILVGAVWARAEQAADLAAHVAGAGG